MAPEDRDKSAQTPLSQRARALWERLGGWVRDGQEPLNSSFVVLVRRRSHIDEGRLRIHFEACLYGDNPFALERFGDVQLRADGEEHPVPQALRPAVKGLRYYVPDPARYDTFEAAQHAWAPLGGEVIALPNEGP